jgi:hypothetical protein
MILATLFHDVVFNSIHQSIEQELIVLWQVEVEDSIYSTPQRSYRRSPPFPLIRYHQTSLPSQSTKHTSTYNQPPQK